MLNVNIEPDEINKPPEARIALCRLILEMLKHTHAWNREMRWGGEAVQLSPTRATDFSRGVSSFSTSTNNAQVRLTVERLAVS
jgi:hypothetical protein